MVANSNPMEEEFILTADTRLVGSGAVLDSLQLVNFILEVEARLSEEIGLQITLTNDRAFSERRSPFRTPAALATYIASESSECQGR